MLKLKLVLVFSLFKFTSCVSQFYSFIDFNLTAKEFNSKYEIVAKQTELNDEGLENYLDTYYLYCEPPQILNENGDCKNEISVKEWRKVFEHFSYIDVDDDMLFVYRKDRNSKFFGKIKNKKKFNGPNPDYKAFIAISSTAESGFELLEFTTCREEILNLTENFMENGLDNTRTKFFICVQLLSIVCFVILLIIYASIEELRKDIQGKCWIHFLVNSLLNYLFVVISIGIFLMDDVIPEDNEIVQIILIALICFIVFTEYSLYIWVNLTFFETFYTIR
jgi:hypothetical protein